MPDQYPIAILIFKRDSDSDSDSTSSSDSDSSSNSDTVYRAYSPAEYRPPNPNDEYPNNEVEQFLSRVYQQINYNPGSSSENTTNNGKLQEVHLLYSSHSLQNREKTCYFSTYSHPHCTYKPVFRTIPVFFDEDMRSQYRESHPNRSSLELYNESCSHEFV